MKKNLTKNWFLKLLSILFAFILWLVVVNINDPDKSVAINRIPIGITNEEKITNQGIGQIYSIEYPAGGVTSIVVKGPRSVVDNLTGTSKGVSASVDFSEVSTVGAVPITYELPDGVTMVSKQAETMRINIEVLAVKTFPAVVVPEGTVAEGYVIGETNISPNRVRVTAPESILEQIDQVIVAVDVDGISRDVELQGMVTLLDSEGKAISYEDNPNVTFSANPLQVKLTIYEVVDVPLDVQTSGMVGQDYRFMGMELSRTMVSVKGLPQDIAALNSITILNADGALDLNGLTSDKQVDIDIQKYLPPGITLLNPEDQYMRAWLHLESLTEGQVVIPLSDITVVYPTNGLEFSYITSGEVYAQVKGLAGDLEQLSASDLHPSIYADGMPPGQHVITVYLDMPDGIELLVSPVVTIWLNQPETEPETSSVLDGTTESTSSTDMVEPSSAVGETSISHGGEVETQTSSNVEPSGSTGEPESTSHIAEPESTANPHSTEVDTQLEETGSQ